MSRTLINLDNQAKAKIFSFGSVGENSLVTFNSATSGQTVLDVKGSMNVVGNIIVAVAPTADSHAVNKLFVDSAVQTINSNVSAVEGRATTLESEMDAVEGRLDTAEPKISTLEGEMDAVEGRLDTAEPKISTLEGEMDAVEGRLDTAEPKISTLEGEMDAVEGDIAHITGTTLVAMVSATSTVANDLASEVSNRTSEDSAIRTDFASADAATLVSANDYTDAEITDNVTDKLAAANGIATLGADAKILTAQLPDSVLGQVEYQGVLTAAGVDGLPSAADAAGHYYVASEELTVGTINFMTGDWIISDGTNWDKVDNTDAVATVHGRMGNVIATKGDYKAELITISGVTSISSDNVKGAIGELVSDIADEVTRATNAESALDGRVTTAESDIVDLMSEDTAIRTDFASADAATLVSANDYTDAEISTEVSNRNAAILVEQERAEGAELTLTTNLATEVSDRTAADADLQSQIDSLGGAARITKKVTIVAGTGNTFNVTESFNEDTLMVYVNGLLMSPEFEDDYSVAGQVVTFNYALESGDKVIAYGAI
jgi:hypothetical protein